MGAERSVAFCPIAPLIQDSRLGTLPNQAVEKNVGLLRPAAGSERLQLAAAHHSQKGLPFRDSRTVLSID